MVRECIGFVFLAIWLWIVFAFVFSRFTYKVCKRDKECRNINCKKALDCQYNSFYNPKRWNDSANCNLNNDLEEE